MCISPSSMRSVAAAAPHRIVLAQDPLPFLEFILLRLAGFGWIWENLESAWTNRRPDRRAYRFGSAQELSVLAYVFISATEREVDGARHTGMRASTGIN